MMVAKLRGVVVRLDGALRFVPASVVLQVAPPPRLTNVIGAPPELLGIALFSGVVIPVLAIGPDRGEMLVCQCRGELVGLVGLRVIEAGEFEAALERPDRSAVAFGEGVAALLDVPAFCATVQASALARRRP
jgi:hypothetical protein